MNNLAPERATANGFGGIPQSGPDSCTLIKIPTSDGIEHPVRVWAAASGGDTAPPTVLYLHGIEGHSRWFETTALALARAGISVWALDRRGAGQSSQPKGDIASYTVLLDDVEAIAQGIRKEQPNCALFLIGNCWGGKVAVTLAGRAPERLFQGLILTSPAVATQVDVSLVTKLKIGLSCLFAGRRYFDIPLTAEHFTDNPAYLQYLKSDPLRLRRVTARFLLQSLLLTRACRLAAPRLRMPVLLLQSGKDAIVNVPRLQTWFESIGSPDKTLKIFTSAAHSLDFEPEPIEYQRLLGDWINSRASRMMVESVL